LKALIAYLMENMIIDFQGDLNMDMVRDFLRGDDSREAKQLLTRLVEDRGVDQMMIALADCLQESIRAGVNEDTIREQVRTYSES
jgi:hypothetical protein